jgi:hypothetical protein
MTRDGRVGVDDMPQLDGKIVALELIGSTPLQSRHVRSTDAIHQSHPRYRAPELVTEEIRRVLQSTTLRLLS